MFTNNLEINDFLKIFTCRYLIYTYPSLSKLRDLFSDFILLLAACLKLPTLSNRDDLEPDKLEFDAPSGVVGELLEAKADELQTLGAQRCQNNRINILVFYVILPRNSNA